MDLVVEDLKGISVWKWIRLIWLRVVSSGGLVLYGNEHSSFIKDKRF
jgi:hypothetical protein